MWQSCFADGTRGLTAAARCTRLQPASGEHAARLRLKRSFSAPHISYCMGQYSCLHTQSQAGCSVYLRCESHRLPVLSAPVCVFTVEGLRFRHSASHAGLLSSARRTRLQHMSGEHALRPLLRARSVAHATLESRHRAQYGRKLQRDGGCLRAHRVEGCGVFLDATDVAAIAVPSFSFGRRAMKHGWREWCGWERRGEAA
jgi:hypothetical protein